MNSAHDRLKSIPSVETILNAPSVRQLSRHTPRWLILDAVHLVLGRVRGEIRSGNVPPAEQESLLEFLIRRVERILPELNRFHLKPVINATGVVIHTNLGRSILSKEVMEQVVSISSSYSNLEYHIPEGGRGSRYSHVETLLGRLCGVDSGLVVNNNAGAVLLSLNTLAEGREVIVSRGELVEIGGSFRIPDVMAKSGCILVEVGTTNKTHPEDYIRAINERTGCLLKVHRSNFEMRGFTQEVSHHDLAGIARRYKIPFMEDLGSGSLIDLSRYGLKKEPTVQDSLRKGADLVTFSGDKLLGGPQAGILVGKKILLDRIKKNPLTRALRVDKMTLAALEVTLRELLDPANALRNIPTLRMLTLPTDELKNRAESLAGILRARVGKTLPVDVVEDVSQVGGGALPDCPLTTFAVALGADEIPANRLEREFRLSDPPVIGRIRRNRLLLDLRTIRVEEFEKIVDAAGRIAKKLPE